MNIDQCEALMQAMIVDAVKIWAEAKFRLKHKSYTKPHNKTWCECAIWDAENFFEKSILAGLYLEDSLSWWSYVKQKIEDNGYRITRGDLPSVKL